VVPGTTKEDSLQWHKPRRTSILPGDDRYDVLHHLEGNFPGGTADLRFRFTLRNGKIARLVIEP
jgi:hypothetical protein